MDNFSKRLRKALEINNMKPIELADKLKINKGIISNYLSGRYNPKYDRITDIARVLNVTEAWLLGYDKDSKLSPKELCEEIKKLIMKSSLDDKDKEKLIEDVEYICLR